MGCRDRDKMDKAGEIIELTDGINYRYYTRCITHGALMAISIFIAAHPEWAMYAPVFQYLGQSIDAPR